MRTAEPRIRVIGFGMGPQHLTPEAADALRGCDYVIAAAKAEDDPLLEVRRAICAAQGVELIAVPDPERDRSSGLSTTGYQGAVVDWHDARAAAYRQVLDERGGTVAFLVWGDPSLYDSTVRVVERLGAEFDVVPGISAPQLLAARHRIVLHEVGRPVHITTARRLPDAVATGQENICAMLTSDRVVDALDGLDDWQLWWGANLGAAGEQLLAGRVADVRDELVPARARARGIDGWVMDLLLVRKG